MMLIDVMPYFGAYAEGSVKRKTKNVKLRNSQFYIFSFGFFA